MSRNIKSDINIDTIRSTYPANIKVFEQIDYDLKLKLFSSDKRLRMISTSFENNIIPNKKGNYRSIWGMILLSTPS